MAFCKICGTQYDEGATFCPGCGTSLGEVVETQAEPVYAEPAYTEPTYTQPEYVEPVYTETNYTNPAANDKAKKMGLIIMILGIASIALTLLQYPVNFVCNMIPVINVIWGFISLFLSIVLIAAAIAAIVLAILSMSKAKKAGEPKDKKVLIGLLTGIGTLVVRVIGFIIGIVILGGVGIAAILSEL